MESTEVLETCAKASQVTEQIGAINAAMESLQAVVTQLEERLTDVSREEIKGDKASNEPPKKELVPLATKIRMATDDVRSQTGRIASLLDRLEL